MNIDGIPTRTLRAHAEQGSIDIIDQTRLPHALHWVRVDTLEGAAHAIRAMQVRGAPLIGATAAYGLAIALLRDASDPRLAFAIEMLGATRPTAVNLHWALARMERVLAPLAPPARCAAAWAEAAAIAEEDVAQNAAIGRHGLGLFRQQERRDGRALNIMTHCNAGWLATVDWGTALSPVYAAHDAGLPVHVWVSETRPRNQGLLTAWELAQHGVPHTVIADNAAGILLREGTDGAVIPIEARDGDEFRLVHGLDARGVPSALHQLPAKEAVANPAFDVTPARLVAAIITERGACPASRDGLFGLYPEEAHG